MRGSKHKKSKARGRSRGLGSPPDVHLSKANQHLYQADIALARAKSAPTCKQRVSSALEAYEHATAADEHMISAGQKPLGERMALIAATIIGTCVIEEAPARSSGRRFTLIKGGRA